MLKCEINKKENKMLVNVEGSIFEITNDLSIEFTSFLENGIRIECLVAALVSAVKNEMKQDEYNQCCEVIVDLLKAIKDK